MAPFPKENCLLIKLRLAATDAKGTPFCGFRENLIPKKCLDATADALTLERR